MNLVILQARCSSTRLPGKVIRPLLGTPMILRQIERIRLSEAVDSIVVATSVDPTDDELFRLLDENGVQVRRGSLEDVLSRFVSIAEEFEPSTIVRLTGDNPLTDPAVIDLVVNSHLASGADYSSNSRVRTFPYGLDVECLQTDALLELRAFDLTPEEKEHVTLGIYTRPESFRLNSVTQSDDHSNLRWSVDYPEDFHFVEAVYRELHPIKSSFGQDDVLELIERRPDLLWTMSDVPL